MVWIIYTANPNPRATSPHPPGRPRAKSEPDKPLLWDEEQVQCGSILVSPGERANKVKTNILLAPTTPDKRNKKTSKHALTVASSFGHVHSFLRDDDVVLNELEKKDANNKCLMLIKKPKTGARQMLKSQSWANLSVSDSNLYKQLDGTFHGDGRRHAKYRMRRKQSDLQQLPPEGVSSLSNSLTDHSNNNLSTSSSDKENHWREDIDDWRSEVMSERSYQSSTLSHSQSQYRQRDGQSNYRIHNYGGREINNNKKLSNGNRMYSSHNDIYSHSKPSRMFEKETKENRALKSDELYKPVRREADIKEEEPVSEQVSRSHSLGDLTTGLTLSLVGQRKYESSQHVAGEKMSLTLPKDTSKTPEDIKNKLVKSKMESKKDSREATAKKESVVSKSETNVNSPVAPAKPRRSLPVVPRGSDVSEKKKHYTEMVRQRINVHSSMSGSSSRQSVNTPQSTSDQSKRVSGTPSDREVSDLLDSQSSDTSSKSSHSKESQNGKLENISEHRASAPVEKSDNTLDTSDFEAGNYATMPSSVRGESGVTTVTSVSSTADSGYSTNDPENDVYSSSSYSKSLQKFAQSLYTNGKGYGGSHRRDSTSQREPVDFNSPFSPPNATSSPTKVNAPGFPNSNNSDSKLSTKSLEPNRRHSSVMRSVSNGDIDPGVRPVSYGAGSPPAAMGNLSVYSAVPVNRVPRADNSHSQPRGRNSSPQRGHKSVVSPTQRQGYQNNNGQNYVVSPSNQHPSPAVRGHNSVGSPTNRHVSPVQRGHHSVTSPTNRHFSPAQRGHNSVSSPTNRHMSQVQRGPSSANSPANRRISPAQKVYNSMTSPPNQAKAVPAWNNVGSKMIPPTSSSTGAYHGHFKTIQNNIDSQNRPSQQGGNPFIRNREQPTGQVKETVVDYRSRSPRSDRPRSPRSERQRSPRSDQRSPRGEPPRILDYPVNALTLNLKHTRSQYNPSTSQPGHSTVTRPMKANVSHSNTSQYSTLPGNFKFNTKSEEDSQNCNTPCLFQILLSHELASVRFTIEDKSVLFNNMRLCECSVALPVLRKLPKKDNSLPVSPQGKYAQLGGPGSAFKPVKIPSSNVSFTMVTVADVSRQLSQYCDVGELQKGDIIVEVNENLVMADSVSGIKARIQEGPEEFVFTVARARSSTSSPKNQKESQSEVENLKKQLESMKQELKRKERAIRELNAMLPWKPESEAVNGTQEINGNCYPSDSLVSGLSEDEFIV
ncbi:dentin sialophosphoprotein-like isoform X2 [Argopecten irradians]|uniref:dentin sialophosphoprotein-like isoform X2 n=1 Tax=Argopecten irradians TaxID=31199 RepID=UPI00371F5FB5